MNASGMINISTASDLDNGKDTSVSFNAGKTAGFDEESNNVPLAASNTAPLQPDPSLLTPKRPNRFFFNNPLSPIASSPETSPPSSPLASGGSNRPKHLQVRYSITLIRNPMSIGNLEYSYVFIRRV